jgi:hypothetical protein
VGLQDWLRAQLNWRVEAGPWVGGSLLIYVVVSNLAWLAARQHGALGRVARHLRDSPGGRWCVYVLRWAFFAGPAYSVLLKGIVPPSSLGLAEIDWIHSVGLGGALAAAALALLCLGWWSYLRAVPSLRSVADRSPLRLPAGWLIVLTEAAALQLHWAFYRSVLATLPPSNMPNVARWAGMGLILIQGMLNPWIQHGLRQPAEAEPIVRRGVLALVTNSLFLIVPNLWLCWLLHALFDLAAIAMSSRKHKETRSHTSS